MNRIYQWDARGRNRGRGLGDNFLAIDDRFVVGQLRFFYHRLRHAGVDSALARNSIWMAAWVASLGHVRFDYTKPVPA